MGTRSHKPMRSRISFTCPSLNYTHLCWFSSNSLSSSMCRSVGAVLNCYPQFCTYLLVADWLTVVMLSVSKAFGNFAISTPPNATFTSLEVQPAIRCLISICFHSGIHYYCVEMFTVSTLEPCSMLVFHQFLNDSFIFLNLLVYPLWFPSPCCIQLGFKNLFCTTTS